MDSHTAKNNVQEVQNDLNFNTIKEDNNNKTQDSLMYSKRGGTVDKGKEYEKCVILYLLLRCLKNDEYTDFRVWSNDKKFGDFDDVILQIENINGSKEKYAIQLKHANKNGKHLQLSSLTAAKGDFSIKKYFKSYQEHKKELVNCKMIIWTNTTLNLPKDKTVKLIDEELILTLEMNESAQVSTLLLTSEDAKFHKFNILNHNSTSNSSKIQDYQDFFQKLLLCTNQKCYDDLEKDNLDFSKTMFCCEESCFNNFTEYIKKCTLTENKLHKLDKTLVGKVLVLRLLQEYICPFSFDHKHENKIFQDMVNKFHVTVFKKQSLENVKKIWINDREKLFCDNKETNTLLRQYQLSKHNSQLDDISYSILLWLINDRPLIVHGSPSTYEVMKLCKNKKFILLEEDAQATLLEGFKVFRRLSDLEDFKDISKKILCNLPGEEVDLFTLIKEEAETLETVTTDILLKISYQQHKILEPNIKELPEPYIKRRLDRNNIDFKYLSESSNKDIVFFLSNITKENESLDCFKNFILVAADDDFSNVNQNHKRIIYISKNQNGQKDFRQLREKIQNMKQYHHFYFVDGKLEWMESVGEVSNLSQYRIETDYLDENAFINKNFHNNINIIIGDPGLGKSVLLRKLNNSFSQKHLTLLLTPRYISKLCNVDNFEQNIVEIMFPKCNNFEKIVLKYLIKKGHVVYLWDALDEVSDEDKLTVIDLISKLSSQSKLQMVTSRRHLKKILEDKSSILSRNIRPFDDEQQSDYIKKRLKSVLKDDEVGNVSSKIRANILNYSHSDVLGIPLQIYMITEMLLRDPKKYNNSFTEFFSLVDLYQHFVDENFNRYFREKCDIDVNNPKQKSLRRVYKYHRIQKYQVVAIKSIFGDEIEVQRYSECNCNECNMVKEGEDDVGFIVDAQTERMTTEFFHVSFAEYFAALYIEEHCRNIPNLKDVIFSRSYTNVRFFFDMLVAKGSLPHIAVLYKNFDKLNECEDMLDKTDSQGRNPLQIVCSWSKEYALLDAVKSNENSPYTSCLINNQTEYSTEEDDSSYQQLLKYLLQKCNPDDIDSLFGYNSIMYAEKRNSIFAIALIESRKKSDYLLSKDHTFLCNLLYYGVKYNFMEAVKLMDKISDNNIEYIYDGNGESLLHLATRNNNTNYVQKLLLQENYKKNIDAKNKKSETALFIATYQKHFEIVRILITNDANVDTKAECDITPLFVASSNGDLEMVKFLVENNANINAPVNDGTTPLHNAAFLGHLEIVQFLVENGANVNVVTDVGTTPLFVNIEIKQSKFAEIVYGNRASANTSSVSENLDMFYAARFEGNFDLIKLLYDNKKNINQNAIKSTGDTPFILAAIMGHTDIVQILVDHEANVNAATSDNITALHLASGFGHLEIVRICIENDTDVNALVNAPLYFAAENDQLAVQFVGLTPLHFASGSGHSEVVEILLENTANINATFNITATTLKSDLYGMTPLHFASLLGHTKTVKILIQKKANIEARLSDGTTPLCMATKMGCLDIVKILCENNANVDAATNDGLTPLHAACFKGNLELATALIENKTNVNATTVSGFTPLLIAVINKHLEIVRLLIKNEANINTGPNGSTPLHIASGDGQLEIVTCLLENKANVDAVTLNGWTPLFGAACNGQLEIVKILIKNKSNVNMVDNNSSTPLHVVAINGDLEIAKTLVENNANINAANKNGTTPLHHALSFGYLEIVKLLIDETNVDATTNEGLTALSVASSKGYLELVKILIAIKANVNAPMHNGWTPLHAASLNNHLEIAKILIENNAYVNVATTDGVTPLHVACEKGHLELAMVLVEENANIHALTNEGWSSLHKSVLNGHPKIIRLLIKNGADIHATTNDGITPLLIAASVAHLEAVEILVEYKADVNVKLSNGWTPLHDASSTNSTEIVQILLENKADTNVVRDDGCTPLHIASHEGHHNTVRILIENGMNINAVDIEGTTPLHLAACLGHLEVVKILTEHNVDTDALTNDNITSLIIASENGHLAIVETLIKNKANVDAKTNRDMTSVHVATANGHLEVVKILMRYGANIHDTNNDRVTPLFLASANGHLEIVRILIGNMACVEASLNSGMTPLHISSLAGHLDIVKLLIENNANIHATTADGLTSLYFAAQNGHYEVVNYLIENKVDIEAVYNGVTSLHVASFNGASIDVVTNNGKTPLDLAFNRGHSEIVKILTEQKKKLSDTDRQTVKNDS